MKRKRKLELNRQTLRNLTTSSLGRAWGGLPMTDETCTGGTEEDPPDICPHSVAATTNPSCTGC